MRVIRRRLDAMTDEEARELVDLAVAGMASATRGAVEFREIMDGLGRRSKLLTDQQVTAIAGQVSGLANELAKSPSHRRNVEIQVEILADIVRRVQPAQQPLVVEKALEITFLNSFWLHCYRSERLTGLTTDMCVAARSLS